MNELEQLFFKSKGELPVNISELPGSGSNRRYFRLFDSDGNTMIGVCGTSAEENEAFVAISRHFRTKGLSVPEVYAVSEDKLCYLQQDLGDDTLFNALEVGRKSGKFGNMEISLLKQTISQLPALQFCGADGLDFSICYPQPEFDERMVFFDLNYFKYCFLKTTGIDFSEIALEDDFRRMCNVLLSADTANTFMYRDFQARNVMLCGGKPYFIDFQGGRRGPLHYDVASFVYQAKACYPEELKDDLVNTYLDSLKHYIPVDEKLFRSQLRHFVLFRTLQVLGAYGFRGYFEKKPHFIQSVPFAIDNLRLLLQQPFEEYPYLSKLLLKITKSDIFTVESAKPRLEVKVCSFAYKKGIPYDVTGNGGGYVFDCRAIHNPGRYERYGKLTGLDKEVVDFLENDGEVFPFLDNVFALVDAHVRRYQERGFASLMVAFGCTGGQHRSVYCAERMAEHLKLTFDVDVRIEHREQKK